MQGCFVRGNPAAHFLVWLGKKSGSSNQGVLKLLVVLIGSISSRFVVILECVVLFTFLGGAGPLSLSPYNTSAMGAWGIEKRRIMHHAKPRRASARAGGPSAVQLRTSASGDTVTQTYCSPHAKPT